MIENNCEKSEMELTECWQPLREQQWPEGTQPIISISCTVFNQIEFVEKCIEAFLNQRTPFPVEILIHDDASTDGTEELIKSYQSRYPELIRCHFQKENQFSKGRQVNAFNFNRVKGDYIALCHGDDYWTDPYKLAKQLSVMKQLKVGLCGHPAAVVDTYGADKKRLTGFKVDKTKKIDARDLIRNNGNMLPFGSIMLTKEAVNDMLDYMPPVRFHTGIQMLGAWRRGLAIMPDVMMAYRTQVPGSTTEIMLGDTDKRFKTTLLRVESIRYLKKIYDNKYGIDFCHLLANQVSYFVGKRHAAYAWAVFGCAIRDQGLFSKVMIAILSIIVSMKAVLSYMKKCMRKS